MNYFVITMESHGVPGRLIPVDGDEHGRAVAADLARKANVSEARIQKEILEDSFPGLHYADENEDSDDSGVWVIVAEKV